MSYIALLIGMLLFAIPSGVIVRHKRGSWFAGFALGFLLGPIGLVVALALPSRTEAMRAGNGLRDLRRCPSCSEFISACAPRCRHCGDVVEPLASIALRS